MEAEAIRSELVEQPQSSAVTKQFYDNFRNPKESRCLEIYIAYIHSWQARVQDTPLLGLQDKFVIPNRKKERKKDKFVNPNRKKKRKEKNQILGGAGT